MKSRGNFLINLQLPSKFIVINGLRDETGLQFSNLVILIRSRMYFISLLKN